ARFNILTLQNRLDSHLMEVDSQARQRVDNLINELLEKDPAPDKMADTMAWTRHMNQIKAQAEELVIQEIIYS
ncbi:TnpV protein, partial [Blautia sp. MSK.20.85]|uniref:TnpV protein n=1 Tax=Blautia sp. MSK.20.85 TaxID=2709718 RepID=UPI001FC8C539